MLARAAACSLRLRYAELVASGALRTDAAQEAAVLRLSQLQAELRAHRAAVAEHAQALAAHAAAKEEQVQRLLREASHAQASGASAQASPQRGWFSGMLSTEPSRPAPPGRTELEAQALAAVGPPPPAPHAPRGLYLFGGVGVGKTLLMDLFYDAAANTVGASHARRVHFNAFANAVHYELHQLSQSKRLPDTHATRAALLAARRRRGQALAHAPEPTNAAVLTEVASRLLPSTGGPSLLCFDELQVNDAFTAVALKGVLDTLLHSGVTLVITSNRAPEDMQVGAAQQRALYEEFAATLRERCEPWQVSSTKDYRAEAAASQQGPSPLAFHSLDAASAAALDALHASACAGSACAPQMVPVMFGRTLHVARACAGVARASYAELCDRPLGAADYIALAERFHTVVLDGVPRMPAGAADVARRFITLIDELYNARCVLLFSAAAPPAELFAAAAGEAPLLDLESLQFESEAEGARSRRDVGQDGGVAPVAGTATAMAGAVAALGGAAERFAFARALSRLAEMGTASWVRRSRAPRCVQDVLLTHFA